MKRASPATATDAAAAAGWARVEALVGTLLDQEPARRATMLDSECGDDADLRREVESLLAAHDASGALDALAADVAPLAAQLRGPGDASSIDRSSADRSSARVGRYRLGPRVAGGGMGVVHTAVDEQLGRVVALKFLRARLDADDSAAERFRREARALAALEHPNICTVHEIGEDTDGRLFIAMPLYAGETLQRRIERGPLPIADAVAIAAQVARGLAKAHDAGVIHRDVKPSNVFLTADGVVKLLDFGIAKLADATLTGTNAGPIGTVAYMSPEQARGDAVDQRTDLWSLGVVLHEMLSGGPRPFPGDVPAVVLDAIRGAVPVPLSALRSDVPPALAAIVARLLEKSPGARYPSAQALEQALASLDAAHRVHPRRRAARQALVVASLAAAALVAAALVVRRDRAGDARPPSARTAGATAPGVASTVTVDRSIVVLPFVTLGADTSGRDVGEGVAEEVAMRLAAVPELTVISRTSARRYARSTLPLPQVARELHVAHVLEGSVRRRGERQRIAVQLVDARVDRRLWSASYDVDPRDPFRVQEEIARQVVRALEVTLRDEWQLRRRGTPDVEAQQLYRRGRFHWDRRTAADHVLAIQSFERAIARDSAFADAWAGLADAHLTAYQLGHSGLSSAESYTRQKRAAERALALDDQSAAAHVSFAISLWWQRNWPGAEREMRRAIALNPGNVWAHYWYALLLGGTANTDEALRVSRRALELDPFALISQTNSAWACHMAGDFACAIEHSQRVLALNGEWVPARSHIGVMHAFLGHHADAERHVRAALVLDPRNARHRADLAFVLARAGRPAAARRELERARARSVSNFDAARVLVALGDVDGAFALLERHDWTWPHRGALVDPALVPLRSDPRYERLVDRVYREMGMR